MLSKTSTLGLIFEDGMYLSTYLQRCPTPAGCGCNQTGPTSWDSDPIMRSYEAVEVIHSSIRCLPLTGLYPRCLVLYSVHTYAILRSNKLADGLQPGTQPLEAGLSNTTFPGRASNLLPQVSIVLDTCRLLLTSSSYYGV